jgi:hypothetical protein
MTPRCPNYSPRNNTLGGVISLKVNAIGALDFSALNTRASLNSLLMHTLENLDPLIPICILHKLGPYHG